jgi:hypothetical protein
MGRRNGGEALRWAKPATPGTGSTPLNEAGSIGPGGEIQWSQETRAVEHFLRERPIEAGAEQCRLLHIWIFLAA